MDETKKNERTRLIEDSCGSDFAGTVTSYHETVISQTHAAGRSHDTQKEPAKSFRTKSFWIAEQCARFKIAKAETRSDTAEPNITGIAFLNDGLLVACDKNNMKIKLFSRDLIMTYELHVGAKPFDVAAVDQNIAIVSFPNPGILQYVLVKPGVRLGHKIPINETCLGVTVRKSQIYVCIAEFGLTERNGHGKENIIRKKFHGIKVFSIKGKLIYSISHQGYGYAKHLCISDDGMKIFYTGGEERDAFAACVTKDGHGVFRYSDEMLQFPIGMTLDRNGNLIIGDLVNGLMYVVNSDGKNRKYLFDSDDRTNISSLAFNVENGLLVVGRFSALNAYFLLKPCRLEKEKLEVNDSRPKEIARRKCCVLL